MLKIGAIQVLRALAANLVVLTHVYGIEQMHRPGTGILPGWFEHVGMCGVYLFFVISGFVIVRAAPGEDWRKFLAARITRIYPTYWFYTALLLAGYLIASPQRLTERADVSLLASMTLWPTAEKPFLVVGWTLIHEMYFYLVIAAIIAAGLRPVYALALWAVAIVAGQLLLYEASPVAAVVFSPLTLFFIAGAALGLTIGQRDARARKASLIERGAVALGDASYSTYLAHFLVISALWKLAYIMPWQVPEWALIGASVAASNVCGLISYRFIEKPLMSVARQLTRKATTTLSLNNT